MNDVPQLDFANFDPVAELAKTQSVLTADRPAGAPRSAPASGADQGSGNTPAADYGPGVVVGDANSTDYLGRTVDPKYHIVDSSGNPLVKNGNILLKKGKYKRIFDRLLGRGDSETVEPAADRPEIPKSDHEREKEVRENEAQARAHAEMVTELDVNSESAADTMWIVYGALLGPEAYNEYDRLNPKLKKHFEMFERRTGKSIDLPPGVALAVGLGTVGLDICRKQPECNKRFAAAKDAVSKNLGGYLKSAFGKDQIPEGEKEEARADDQV